MRTYIDRIHDKRNRESMALRMIAKFKKASTQAINCTYDVTFSHRNIFIEVRPDNETGSFVNIGSLLAEIMRQQQENGATWSIEGDSNGAYIIVEYFVGE